MPQDAANSVFGLPSDCATQVGDLTYGQVGVAKLMSRSLKAQPFMQFQGCFTDHAFEDAVKMTRR